MKRRQFSVENELSSLRVVSKNRQHEADLKQSSTYSASLCHDTNSSVSFTDTDISLTQQIHSIQEQSASCPLPDIPLPPLLSAEKKVTPISFLSIDLQGVSSVAKNPFPPSHPAVCEQAVPTPLSPLQSQSVRGESPATPSRPRMCSAASSQQLRSPVMHSQPSRSQSQVNVDPSDTLLDISVLEEADRIEAEETQSQVLDDQDLFKAADGRSGADR